MLGCRGLAIPSSTDNVELFEDGLDLGIGRGELKHEMNDGGGARASGRVEGSPWTRDFDVEEASRDGVLVERRCIGVLGVQEKQKNATARLTEFILNLCWACMAETLRPLKRGREDQDTSVTVV